jgi:PGF-pre-PGF domain-containing protein
MHRSTAFGRISILQGNSLEGFELKYISLALVLFALFVSPACATYYVEGTHLSALDGVLIEDEMFGMEYYTNDDNYTGPLNIGFTFPFYGADKTQFYVTTNGVVSFGGANTAYNNVALPAGSYNYPALFPFWDDLAPYDLGYILYDTIAAGESGNPYGTDVLVVQWTNYRFLGTELILGTFQAHLVSDGNITFNYNSLVSTERSYGQSATIGIQENGAGSYVQHSRDTDAGIRSGYAINFAYNGGTSYTKSEAGTDGFWDLLLYKDTMPPGKPSSPNPSVGATTSTSPTLSWSSGNATNYTVRVSVNADLSGASSNLTTESSLSLSGLSENTTYYWHVIARNDGGESHSDLWNFITSSGPVAPVANFSANVTSGAVPLAVNFTDQSTNTPTSWLWDFGDGNASTEQNPIHTYASVGTYTVSLNATNAAGSNTSTLTSYITAATAPVSGFSADVTSGAVPLAVTFTDQSTNSPTSWSWNFGDGNTSTDQNPTHTYASVGTYTVSLNATNVGGSNVSTQTNYITTAIAPVADFSANVTSGALPLSVSFTDQSTNTPTNWEWNFGDGNTSTDQNPTHTYVTVGTYNVSLNATNVGGSNVSTQTNYITVAIAPVSGFSADVTSGAVPLMVNFTDLSTNAPTSWEWDFGDGNTSTDQNPTHTYAAVGTYNVSLNATNEGGSNTATQTDYITAAVAPVANFTADVTSGTGPLSVSFTDLSTNTPVTWEWDFGDGTNSTDQNVTHTYSSAGTYTVSLNASNAGGYNITTQTDYITVTSTSSDSSRRASVSPGQPPESVTSTYTSVKHVMGGTKVEYDLSDGNGPVLGISFDAKDNEGVVVAKVQVLSDRPEGVSTPPGNSYQLMSIDVGSQGTISSHNADNIMINFRVSWEWINENNIDPATIRMTRYHDGEWQELPTGKVSDDGEYLYFVAETQGFSIFSVVGDELKAVTGEAEPVAATFAEDDTGEPVTAGDKKTPGFTAVSGLIFVSFAFLASRRSRQ